MSTETESPLRIKTSWLIGTLAAFAIFAVIAAYSGHMTRAYTSYDQQRAHDRYITLEKVRADEDKLLNSPADWVDQGKQTVHIPIDEAMAREVDALKAKPVGAGSALPAPMPPPAPAAAAAPAASAATPSTNAAPAAPAKPTK